MESKPRRRDYIISNVKRQPTVRKKTERKQHALTYTLPLNENKIRVCKKMFLRTLSISETMIYYSLNKVYSEPKTTANNRVARNNLPKESYDFVVEHINSFPKLPSHYCRSNSNKQYLDSLLNVNEMYRLYGEKCTELSKEPVTKSMYRSIFNYDFNLAFHEPKKDACDTCAMHKLAEDANDVTEEKRIEYEAHMRRKNQARENKETDKRSDPKYVLVAALTCSKCYHAPGLLSVQHIT